MAGYIGSKSSVTQVDGYNRTEADAEFVAKAGDTMTGALTGTDLTLSGGVYLGGTGAANKLDDYEEGTWTPVDASGAGLTFGTINTPSYTKIGRLCYVFAYVSYPGTSSTLTQAIGGLPFTARSGSYYAQLTVRVTSNSVSSQNLTFQVTDSSNNAIIHEGAGALTNADMSGNSFLLSGVYETA